METVHETATTTLMLATGRFVFSENRPIDRRARIRFCLDLHGRYRSLEPGSTSAGFGSVLNISSVGVLMTYQGTVPIGSSMELRIEWPALSATKDRMELVVVGDVLRCENGAFAIIVNSTPGKYRSIYRFKTMERTEPPLEVLYDSTNIPHQELGHFH